MVDNDAAVQDGPGASTDASTVQDAPGSSTDSSTGDVSSDGGGAAIKWHPGQYMSSGVYTELGNVDESSNPAGPEKASEISLVRSGPSQVLGWEGYYFWRSMENAEDTYDMSSAGSGLDADYAAITGYTSGSGSSAVYSSPRRMGIYILHTDYFNANPSARAVPNYLLDNATYGPIGPDGTYYGYWTTTGSGGTGTGSVVAFWRPVVEARYVALLSGLAKHVLPDGYTVDTSPYVEWVKLFLESADSPELTTDSSYNVTEYLAQLEALNLAAASAFPHTNVVCTINWLDDPNDIVTLSDSLATHRSGSGGPDIAGYSSGQNFNDNGGIAGLTWGQMAYIGLLPPSSGNTWVTGGTDKRGVVPYLGTIQNTETVYNGSHNYTPADLFEQANATLKATHVAWQNVSGQTGSLAAANWLGTASSLATWSASTSGGVLAEVVNSTLATTACPSSYANGCNMSP